MLAVAERTVAVGDLSIAENAELWHAQGSGKVGDLLDQLGIVYEVGDLGQGIGGISLAEGDRRGVALSAQLHGTRWGNAIAYSEIGHAVDPEAMGPCDRDAITTSRYERAAWSTGSRYAVSGADALRVLQRSASPEAIAAERIVPPELVLLRVALRFKDSKAHCEDCAQRAPLALESALQAIAKGLRKLGAEPCPNHPIFYADG